MKLLILFSIIVSQNSFAQSSVTVRLAPAKPYRPPSCARTTNNTSVKKQANNLSCLIERAKYKCKPINKSQRPIKGIGSYYGQGDEFTGGATRCEKPFFPKTDKILALQDSLIPRGIFLKSLCGRKAVVVAVEPDTGRCTSTEVEISDTGNLGARDPDNNNNTRDILKRDVARAGKKSATEDRKIGAARAFDLSYAAAKALRYADPAGMDDGKDDGKAYMEVTICEEMAPASLTPGATRELRRRSK